MTTPLHYQGAVTLAGRIRRREVGSRELLEHFLARIDRLNPQINAVVLQQREQARAAADAADAALARGDTDLGPLHGLPMTVKESYDVAGLPTAWGRPELKDNLAQQDALAVQRLKAAGAVVFGKTNVPINLADMQSYNAIHGTTHNPYRHGRTPGGSSGGSAAALAAGFTALELGSDIGGSIRNPSHYCGVFGLKPTWNLLPMRGHALGGILTPTDISVIGPMARSADDLELVLDLLAKPDAIEARGGAVHLPGLEPGAGLRVAVWDSDPFCPSSAAVRARIAAVAQALHGQHLQVDTRARPDFSPEHSHAVFSGLLHSAMSARTPDAEYAAMVREADALPPEDTSPRAMVLRAQTLRARDWQRLNEQRTRLRWAWHRFFEQWDCIITPVMPTTAFAYDHRPFGQRTVDVDGSAQPYFNQIFWAGLAGVAQLPAVVVPAGPADDGLPVGVQLIGPHFGDRRLVQIAHRLQALGFGFVPPPALD